MTKPVQVVELRYKRCSLRFGVGTCTATGTPKCFQTYATCKAKEVYNQEGGLSWYFHRSGDSVPPTAALPFPNFPYPPSIPILQTVSSAPTRINLGAVRENESPFGLRGTITVSLTDFEYKNQFGDFYADERTVKGSLGRLLLAWLGEAVPQIELYIYSGTSDDTDLTAMTVRRYDVLNISPPSDGVWNITAIDPLARAERKKAQFPPPTDLRLQSDINANTVSITVSGKETDLSKNMGNDGFFYGRFGSEIIRYTSYTGSEGIWTLTEVKRGHFETQATNHSLDAGFQRIGYYSEEQYWKIVYDLLINHTTITENLIPYTENWVPEGEGYLSTLLGTGVFSDPRPVTEICAEAMRDGMFSIWWDERSQKIKMLANRQPTSEPVTLNERQSIVSTSMRLEPDQRRTRVTIYYDRRDPTASLTEGSNYRKQRIRIDAEAEGVNFADGTVRNLIWYSSLLRSDINAVIVQASFLQRYVNTPRYLSIELADKDSELNVGDVVLVDSYDVLDTLGQPSIEAWQVIEWEEVEPKFKYRILCQSFNLFERPMFIMADDAPDFATATAEQKIKAGYISEDDGSMPDGSAPYVIQ